jgi:hypothetical protein
MTGIESEDRYLTDVKRRLSSKSEANLSRCACPGKARCQRHSKTNYVSNSHSTIMRNDLLQVLKARSISRAMAQL